MRGRSGLAAIMVLLMALTLLFRDRAAADEAPPRPLGWFVAELRGSAFSLPGDVAGGQWQPLRPGALVAAGSVVRTEADSHLLLVNRVDRILLSPNSELELPDGKEGDSVTRVIHWLGTAIFDVGRRPSPQFEVSTPYLVAIVKGTVFTTTVSEAGASLEVKEGIVGASPAGGGASIDVAAGEAASVSADDRGTVSPGELSNHPAAGHGGAAGQPADAGAGTDLEASTVSGAGSGEVVDGDAAAAHGRGQGGGNGNAFGRDERNPRAGKGNGRGGWHGCRGQGGCHRDDDDRPNHDGDQRGGGQRATVIHASTLSG